MVVGEHTQLIKFLRDEDGFFYNGHDSREVFFVQQGGIEFLTEKAARAEWRKYEFRRTTKPEQDWPKMKLARFKITVEKLSEEDFDEAASDMRLTIVTEKFGFHSKLPQFVRSLAQRPDFMDFKFIILRHEQALNRVRRGDCLDLSAVPNAIMARRKSNRAFIAVKTEAELIYLRMALAANLKAAIDMDTGAYVLGEEYDNA